MIKLTNKATKQLINIIKNQKDCNSIFMYIKGGGCNGFSYKFKFFNDKLKEVDAEIINIEDYKLYLCKKSLIYIIGTKIDYISDIMGSRFDFKNENIDSKCGCGTSFNFKDI